MKNDELFRSLSRMAEEYDRLVSPLIKQLKIYDRWHEITSPILRVAEMHDDVLKGVTAFDTSLADHLTRITEPYQPMLDNMAAIEGMMGTRFSELVHPHIYVPGIASGLNTLASAATQIGQEGIFPSTNLKHPVFSMVLRLPERIYDDLYDDLLRKRQGCCTRDEKTAGWGEHDVYCSGSDVSC